MKISLNKIREAENFLDGRMSAGASLLFQVRLVCDPGLRLDVALQQKVRDLIRMYHRKKVREEVGSVHERIFSDPVKSGFSQSILLHFKDKQQ